MPVAARISPTDRLIAAAADAFDTAGDAFETARPEPGCRAIDVGEPPTPSASLVLCLSLSVLLVLVVLLVPALVLVFVFVPALVLVRASSMASGLRAPALPAPDSSKSSSTSA
jgi:hypothetical protein